MGELAVVKGRFTSLPDDIMSRWGIPPDSSNKTLHIFGLAGKGALVIPDGQTWALIEMIAPESKLRSRAKRIEKQDITPRTPTIDPSICSNERVYSGQFSIPVSIRPKGHEDGGTVYAKDLDSAILLLPSDTSKTTRRKLIKSLVPVDALIDGSWAYKPSLFWPFSHAYTEWQTERGRKIWKLVNQGGSSKGFGASRHQDTVLGRKIGLDLKRDAIKASLIVSPHSVRRRKKD